MAELVRCSSGARRIRNLWRIRHSHRLFLTAGMKYRRASATAFFKKNAIPYGAPEAVFFFETQVNEFAEKHPELIPVKTTLIIPRDEKR